MTTWLRSVGLIAVLSLGAVPAFAASIQTVPVETLKLIKEIQGRLNVSFHCEFSISIGQTRKYAIANSSGIIIVDRAFLETADRGRICFAIAHEYAPAYLQHDVGL
ncbi:MAG: hypothetical protein EXQ58_08480 [Acidobacteria bacterium]|nr:hypothetical protein [Acidobacteriota bacterium]